MAVETPIYIVDKRGAPLKGTPLFLINNINIIIFKPIMNLC